MFGDSSRMRQRAVGFALATVVALCLSCAAPEEPGRPNILFIAVDDLRPEFGCYGAESMVSPNIDRLAAERLIFTGPIANSRLQPIPRQPDDRLTTRHPPSLGLKTDIREPNPERCHPPSISNTTATTRGHRQDLPQQQPRSCHVERREAVHRRLSLRPRRGVPG